MTYSPGEEGSLSAKMVLQAETNASPPRAMDARVVETCFLRPAVRAPKRMPDRSGGFAAAVPDPPPTPRRSAGAAGAPGAGAGLGTTS